MRKSVENLLVSSHDVVSSSISSLGSALPFSAMTLQGAGPGAGPGAGAEPQPQQLQPPSPQHSPQHSPRPNRRPSPAPAPAHSAPASPAPAAAPPPAAAATPATAGPPERTEPPEVTPNGSPCNGSPEDTSERSSSLKDSISRSSDSSQLAAEAALPSSRAASAAGSDRKETRSAERTKKKSSWYSALYPTYKSRSEDFKRLFKDLPADERLIVDYSCALQKDILLQGRLYVSQNYLCFYANIFRWETQVTILWKDVTSITKEKTALVIPNAVLIGTESEKYFFTTFTARDKTYLMLFRVWQNALLDQQLSLQEMWQWVHTCYGDELGLTSDDEDYVPPSAEEEKPPGLSARFSVESFSELPQDCCSGDAQMDGVDGDECSAGDAAALALAPGDLPLTLTPSPTPPLPTPANDLLPTDMSDTTESDGEKAGGHHHPLTCPAPHEGRKLLRVVLPMHIDQLFTLLFTSSKFMLDFHSLRRTTDIVLAPWQQSPGSQLKQRTLTMTVALTQPVGPKTTQVCEAQLMLPCSEPGQLYAIDVESSNAGIPYADSFYVTLHYCLARTGEREASLAVYAQIKYRKSVWGLVKSFIERNTWAGLDDFYTALARALRAECDRLMPSKKKKQRRWRQSSVAAAGGGGVGAGTGPRLAEPGARLPMPAPTRLLTGGVGRVAGVGTGGRGGAGAGSAAGAAPESLAWALLGVLLVLLALNALLYYKLWLLEARAAGSGHAPLAPAPLPVFRAQPHSQPRSHEDWLRLLQQQEALHSVEMRKWQKVLQAAIRLLRQTEESLAELQLSISPLVAKRVLAVLRDAAPPAAPPAPAATPAPAPAPAPDEL